MTYKISEIRNQIIRTTLPNEFSNRELEHLAKLLAIDTQVRTDKFLSAFRELKGTCPLINQLCSPQGCFRKIFYSFKSDTKKAERYKIIIEQLRTGKDQNNLRYFGHYLQELSVGQKINTVLIEKFKNTFDVEESIHTGERVATQNIYNFNKNINFIGAFNTSNLNNFSDNSSELLTSYINSKSEYSCLSHKDIDSKLDQVNIMGTKISELKKKFIAELTKEVTRLYGENPDNNIDINTHIWEGNSLNPKIGSLIKQIHKKHINAVKFVSNQFKNKVKQRLGIKPYLLNFVNMQSAGYCCGISIAATYLSTQQLYANQWLYDNSKLNIIDNLQELIIYYRENGNFEYPIAFICQGLIAALIRNGNKFDSYLIMLKKCISDENLFNVLSKMEQDTEIRNIFNDDTLGIYGHFIHLHQIGQADYVVYSPDIKSILQKYINTQYTLLNKKDIVNINFMFSVAHQNSTRRSKHHAITIKIEKTGDKIALLLIDSNRKLGPLYFIIKNPEEIINISKQLTLYLKQNSYNIISDTKNSPIIDIEDRYRKHRKVQNSVDIIEENRYIHTGTRGIDGKYIKERFTGKSKMTFENARYQGELLNSKAFGFGTLKWGDHEKVTGNFWDDTITNGEYRFLNDIYNGSLKNYKPHGYGRYEFDNGNVYEGFFNLGKKHGYGIIKSHEGITLYEGNFINDEKEINLAPIG